ncbi:replication restart helicase PriA [Bergeyella sp. RCAD1439]|uniref:replication restart helicase PriA n=1 Tax=Bergeyella anatis TaxID=3113737 RepID=UPI002E183784|nr:primosomal protein N' [Bergeyella sp. RCAD1439]
MTFAEVILPLNLKGVFTYRIPEAMASMAVEGMRVLVPFRGRKIYTGIILRLHDTPPEDFSPKEIISFLDDAPLLPRQQLDFWLWLSAYYLCNIGEIYRLAFPSSLKLESETYLKLKPNVRIEFELLDVNETYLIQALEVRQLVNLTEIEAFIPKRDIIGTINSLLSLQYIEIDEKVAEKYKAKEVAYVRLGPNYEASELSRLLVRLKRSPKQQELFLTVVEKLTEHPENPLRKSTLFEEGAFSQSQFKSLCEKGLLEEYHLHKDRLEAYEGATEALETLTETQSEANEKMTRAFASGKNVLLHGVTASGKTHLYLEQIEKTLSEGKNTLLLLPEIALTKQILQRLEKKYGKQIGFYHQKLTDFERVEVWKKIKNNTFKVVVSTRIGLFLPFENLGLVIVDEEHDSAYRPREASPYFNGRDAAMVLAEKYDARLLLGSATPSVDSYYLAEKGKLERVYLGERFGRSALPVYELLDFKEAQDTKKVNGNFTLSALEEMKTTLEHRRQIMVLHNRRGYANVVECEGCGYVTYCSNCDVVMTYHKYVNELKCHYCGHKSSKPRNCPKCNSEKLNTKGIGVEQIYEEVGRLFPDAGVDRMDVDSMRRKFAYEKLYEKIENRETDIIVGTQMMAKGLDFEAIDLVVVPRADQMLYVQDYRAEERAYQLITQISGRAGRSSGLGRVLIQTFNPTHSVFQLIKASDHRTIYDYLLEERKKFHYPPFTKTILIELKHRKEDKVDRASQFLGSVLRKYLPIECILGPEKAPIAKINLMYHYQILLKLPRGKRYTLFKKEVVRALAEFDEITGYQSVKKNIYVDF